ncbi:MAG: hypothetical protein JKY65_16100 [Planctomycetes bacterium]|nr:hypothetical protein [Planctomycetota bacterium]
MQVQPRTLRSQTMTEVIILTALVGVLIAIAIVGLPYIISELYTNARNHITAPF